MDGVRCAGSYDASIAAIAVEVWPGTYLQHGVNEVLAEHLLAKPSAGAVCKRFRSGPHLF